MTPQPSPLTPLSEVVLYLHNFRRFAYASTLLKRFSQSDLDHLCGLGLLRCRKDSQQGFIYWLTGATYGRSWR